MKLIVKCSICGDTDVNVDGRGEICCNTCGYFIGLMSEPIEEFEEDYDDE